MPRRRSRSRLATACLVAVTGGLIGAVASLDGAYHGGLVWPLACLLAGAVLDGSRRHSLRRVVRRSALVALFLPPAAVGLYWARWMETRMQTFLGDPLLRPMIDSGGGEASLSLGALLPLTVVLYVAATLAVLIGALSISIAANRIREALELGPERNRVVYDALLIGTSSLALLAIAVVALGR